MGLPGEVPWEARRAQALAELVADGQSITAPARERPLAHITGPWPTSTPPVRLPPPAHLNEFKVGHRAPWLPPLRR